MSRAVLSRASLVASFAVILLLAGCSVQKAMKDDAAPTMPNGDGNVKTAPVEKNNANSYGTKTAPAVKTNPVEKKTLTGRWTGKVNEQMNGPEGSFPANCIVEQFVQFDFIQSGTALKGNMASTVTKVTACDPAIPQSFIGMKTTGSISGTVNGATVKFSSEDKANLGASDFIGTFSDDSMNLKLETCKSPDTRCTCKAPDKRCPGGYNEAGMPIPGHLETINWWTGEFTIIRAK